MGRIDDSPWPCVGIYGWLFFFRLLHSFTVQHVLCLSIQVYEHKFESCGIFKPGKETELGGWSDEVLGTTADSFCRYVSDGTSVIVSPRKLKVHLVFIYFKKLWQIFMQYISQYLVYHPPRSKVGLHAFLSQWIGLT